jgi:ankyrin repeat protein
MRSRCHSKQLDSHTIVVDPCLVIKGGNMNQIKELVECGKMKIHNRRWSGFSLLHKAAEIGFTELCEYLIEQGVSVNERSSRGWFSPLHIALGHGYVDTAFAMIKLGANPWIKNKYHQDAFEYGCQRGYKKICDELRLAVLRMDMEQSIERNFSLSRSSTAMEVDSDREG